MKVKTYARVEYKNDDGEVFISTSSEYNYRYVAARMLKEMAADIKREGYIIISKKLIPRFSNESND